MGSLGTVTEGQKGDPRAPEVAQNSLMVAGKACPAPAGQPWAADTPREVLGAPGPGHSWSLLHQPGLHEHLGGAKAPQTTRGLNGSPTASSCWHKVVLSKHFLLLNMRILLSLSSPSHPNDTETSTAKANKPMVCKRKPADFVGTKLQMEIEISVSPCYCKKLSEGPGSCTNMGVRYF